MKENITMTEQEFVDSVWQKILAESPHADLISRNDEHALKCTIRECWHDRWTIEDTVAYNLCTEEVNPFLNEEAALERMEEIRKKHKRNNYFYSLELVRASKIT